MTKAPQEKVFRNARIVLGDRVVSGAVLTRGGRIVEVDEGVTTVGEDLEGDYLIPGLIELHTDHLEQHFQPRPGVKWPAPFAVQAHDAQMAASGITTVFDALCVGLGDQRLTTTDLVDLLDQIQTSLAGGHLRINHFTHIRCEVPSENVLGEFERLAERPDLKLVSLMDHTPGQRQYVDLDKHRTYTIGQKIVSVDEYDSYVDERRARASRFVVKNRLALAAHCRERGIALASHDDGTLEEVADAVRDGVRIAEFPTTLAAAAASREAGMHVLMGAPNLVRGGSHSGNVSARELAEARVVDVLSSDYVPLSMIQGAFHLAGLGLGFSLPEAIALVTYNPAEAVGLEDRGLIAPGRRADLVRVQPSVYGPVVREVHIESRRVS
ncbi:MAG: alpha-D-ribose 1-methylphosphonate 5-triphosphate diphosphatase [Rhizobiales bacterium]|nr:alpha-D-ribose 1-methylphosphonate 5-triphosphate diphosphatase [Hyphomicrobiales bacterium]